MPYQSENQQRVESQPDMPHMGTDACIAQRCFISASRHGGKGLRYQLSRLHISASSSRWLSASCLAWLQRYYKKQLKAEWALSKTVPLIIIKIPVYLDSQESQRGETHSQHASKSFRAKLTTNHTCSGCALYRTLSEKAGTVWLSCERKFLPDASRPPFASALPSISLLDTAISTKASDWEVQGSDSGVLTLDCSLVLPLSIGDLGQVNFPTCFFIWRQALHKVRVRAFVFYSCDLWWKICFTSRTGMHIYTHT